jgi:signal transduction histidine kinase
LEKEMSLAMAVARLAALAIERERLLRERAEAQATALALLQANRQIDSFLTIASHELRTPVTTIKLALQMAQRRLDAGLAQKVTAPTETDKAFRQLGEHLTRSMEYVARLERLESDLLDVQCIQLGKLAVHPTLENLAVLVGEVVEEQRLVAPDRTFQLQFDSGGLVPIWADADRIRQVVTNYLTNACKYSPAGQPIEVGLSVEGRRARVWVHDHGPGIPPAEQGQVWERFYRAAAVGVQQGSQVGLGLGLYLCRTIIEQHQGQVGLESGEGQGTTFWFALPLVDS